MVQLMKFQISLLHRCTNGPVASYSHLNLFIHLYDALALDLLLSVFQCKSKGGC